MTIKVKTIAVVIVIIAMVAGYKYLDEKYGLFSENPMDRIPSVNIQK